MHYRIEVTPKNVINDEQIDLYEANGWDYVTSVQNFHVFSSPVERNAPEIHTDPAEQSYTLHQLNEKLTTSALLGILGLIAEIMKNYLASFRGEVTTLRKERQAEHQELLDQRAHQHKVFIRIVIAIPAAALLILFSSGYLHYRNSSVYWGNRAYELAAKQKEENPGALYQYVQENFSDSTKQEIKNRIRNAERRLRKEQSGK